MAQVYWSKVIEASAADVWAIVREFGALDTWFPFVEACRLKGGANEGQVGAVRVNTVAQGALIEETLLELSDRDRRIVYALTAGEVPTIDYSATLQVHEVSADGRAFVEWTAQFDVKGEIEPIAKWVRNDIFETCLNELERVAQTRSRKRQPAV